MFEASPLHCSITQTTPWVAQRTDVFQTGRGLFAEADLSDSKEKASTFEADNNKLNIFKRIWTVETQVNRRTFGLACSDNQRAIPKTKTTSL